METHGTGTQAGDPIETGALSKVFGPGRPSDTPLRIGSIKTNVGHLEGTSGVAGVMKAVLMLENRVFLPNRNFTTLNPRIPLCEWNLKVCTQLSVSRLTSQVQLEPERWTSSGPHRISVNSFGYGGSNAHIVLEDAKGYLSSRNMKGRIRRNRDSPLLTNGAASEHSVNGTSQPARTRLFVLSGFDENSCAMQAQRLREYLVEKRPNEESMNDLAYTLNERRTKFMWKAAVTGSSSSVADTLSGKVTPKRAAKKPNIGFVFTGQGAQWCGMGKELCEEYPVFRQSLKRIDAYLRKIDAPFTVEGTSRPQSCEANVLDEVLRGKDSSRLSHPLLSQPVCSALQISLVDLLASWGVFPDSVTGHSSGEIAAAYAVGALCMEDAMSIAYHRGSVAGKLSMTGDVNGAMLAVSMSTDDIQPYLGTLRRGKVVVACKNSPSSLTISGDQTAIEEMEQMLHEKQVFCRRLAVGVAYHSHHMKLIGDEYRAAIAHVKTRSEESKSYRQTVSFFSSVTGTETPSSELGPDYWVRNLLGQVKFVESLQTLSFETNTQKHAPVPTGKRMKRVGAARKVSIDFLIEIGPHSALAGPIKQIIKADSKLSIADITYGSVLIRKSDAVATALALATSLVTSGCSLAFDAINRPSKHRDPQLLVDLPPYPWNHSRSYWAEPRMSKAFRGRRCPRADILGVSDTMSCPFEPRWRNFLRVSEIPWLSDHKIQSNIVYPAAGYIAMVIEASSQLALVNSGKEITGYQLRDVSILSALVINETSAVEIMVSLRPCKSIETVTEYEFHIYSTTDENRWTEHCRGVVGAGNYETGPDEIKHSQHTADLSVLDVGKFYEDLSHVGLEYGPCFANMTQARFAEDVCHAEIAIPDTAATMPMNFQHPFLVHPCTLDSTFHSIFVPVLAKMGRTEEPPVPIHIDQIYVSRSISTSPGTRMEVQASVIQEEDSDIVASLEAIERNSGTVVSITGLTCRRISDSSNSVSNPVDRVAYNFKWEADPDLIPNESLSNLLGTVSDMTKSDLYEQCARYYVEKALSSQSDITMKPYQQRLRSLFQAQRYECTSVETGGIDLKQVKYSGPTGKLLCTLGERIPELMKAEVGPDFDVLNEYLDNASHLVQGYQAASRYLDMLAHKTPSMSVLEIGGTGAASLMFLEQLTGESDILRCAEYTFTHPDASMVESASKALDKWGSRIRSKGLSIEASLETQYFGQQTYDVVIVPYGLYAAVSKRQALKNIRKLLRSNGHLILIDPTSTRSLTNAVIFGHLSAWDETLEDALHEAQFAESAVVKCGDSGSTCSVVISRPLRETRRPSMSVLIIAEDDCGVSIRGLQDHLSLLPIKVEVSDIAHAKPNGRVCIVLSDLKASLFAHPDPKLLEALKQVFLQSAGVLWVTRGGTINATNPDAGLVTGFARTARSESGVSPIVTLDLDGQNMVSRHHAAAIIINLFRHRFIENNTTDDVEYVEKGGVLLIPRVVENIQLNQSIASLHDHNMLSEQAFHQAGRALRMVKRGENIHFVDSRVGLSDGWIGVKVRAIYLDDLKVSKLDPGCSGIVCSIQGVCGFAPGDRVAYLGSGVTNMYYDRETMFQKIPSGMSLEMAAALPAAYSTAFYIVNHLARISSDDIVLVHGASGPNGQSLVELCHMKQAQVFATVAASQKDLLSFRYGIPESQVFDQSETLIRALEMAGRRVDVIINCNGPDKQTPWKFIAPYGQYIQLGREKAEAPRSDVVVSSFDLQTLRRQNPGVLARVWKQVMSLFHEGKLKGPSPLPTYSISNVGQILKSGPQTELLITAGQDDVVQVSSPAPGLPLI